MTAFTEMYWRDRAEEARAIAEQMRDSDARRTLLDIANSYDALADRAAAAEGMQAMSKRE